MSAPARFCTSNLASGMFNVYLAFKYLKHASNFIPQKREIAKTSLENFINLSEKKGFGGLRVKLGAMAICRSQLSFRISSRSEGAPNAFLPALQ